MLIISNDFFLWSLWASVCSKFHAEPPWAGEWKIAKMGMVHWSKWLPCPYNGKKIFLQIFLLHNQISPGPLSLHKLWGDRRATKIAKNDGSMLTFWPFYLQGQILLPHAFVWGPYTFILKVFKWFVDQTVVKIVLIGNLRWPSSCLYLLYFPATVLFTCIKSWFFRIHLANFHQISHWSYCWNVIDGLFKWSCSIDCQSHIFFFKTKNCSNDDLFISCDDRIGKMLHNICMSAVTQVSEPWPVGLLFPLYIYIENFKNLHVRKHWTDFYITRQKCFLGDPLPRLSKPSWFVKKHSS